MGKRLYRNRRGTFVAASGAMQAKLIDRQNRVYAVIFDTIKID
jgi:hypothetical protein